MKRKEKKKTQILCLQFFVENSSTKKRHGDEAKKNEKWPFRAVPSDLESIGCDKKCEKKPYFCTLHPVLCILFCDFCRFFYFRTNAFSKKVNAKFFCGVDFFEPSTAKFFYFSRKAL